jgi:phage gpG-like protein
MAGAGILKAEYEASEFQHIIDALHKASSPVLLEIAEAAGAELERISKKVAFKDEKDPVTGQKWEKLKNPREKGKILWDGGQLRRSLNWNAFPDGSVIFGSNMEYARIHQLGGKTSAHEIKPYNAKALHFNGTFAKRVSHPGSKIPARPYMGVPKDFDRTFLDDPAIKEKLGVL